MSPVRNCSFQVLKHVGMSAIAEDSHSFVVTQLMVAIWESSLILGIDRSSPTGV